MQWTSTRLTTRLFSRVPYLSIATHKTLTAYALGTTTMVGMGLTIRVTFTYSGESAIQILSNVLSNIGALPLIVIFHAAFLGGFRGKFKILSSFFLGLVYSSNTDGKSKLPRL